MSTAGIEHQPTLVHTALASAVSGLLARLLCHPLDTIKARTMVARGGGGGGAPPASLLRGLGVTLAGSAPASMLYFTVYESSRDVLLGQITPPSSSGAPPSRTASAAVHLLAGFAAEAASCVLWVPLDVVKERMQVQVAGGAGPYYTSLRDALSQIRAREGLRVGLYRGYGATLGSYGPFSAIYFVAYEEFKAWGRAGGVGGGGTPVATSPPTLAATVLAACAAGAVASLLTSPLDLVKLRLQVQGGGGAGAYTGLLDGLRSVVREEGARGLMRGAGARVAFLVPSTAIALTCFEEAKKLMVQLV